MAKLVEHYKFIVIVAINYEVAIVVIKMRLKQVRMIINHL
jgi:hypothetical protein